MTASTRRIGSDAFVVGLGYAVSFLYPLVSLPLLSRVFGAELLGVLMFALAVLQLVVFFSEYGFSVSAVRRIAVHPGMRERGEIISSTLAAKFLLFLGSGAAVLVVALLVPGMRAHLPLYLWGLVLVGAGVAFPNWLLQGLGRVRIFAALLAGSRLLGLVGLLLTVRSKDDLLLALTWQLVPLGLAAIGAWVVLLASRQARWQRPTRQSVISALNDGGPLFLSNLAHLLTANSNTLVLGAVAHSTQVAFFGAAERFANAGRGIMQGLQDAMLPRMVAARQHDDGRQVQRFIIAGFLASYVTGGLLLIVNAGWFVPLYLGEEFTPAVPVTQVVGLALCVAGGSAVFRLVAAAAHRYVAIGSIAMGVGVTHVIVLIPATLNFGALGAAATVLLSEIVMVAVYAVDFTRQRKNQKRLEHVF